MNCKSWLTYLLKFVAIWILCGFNTMVTGVLQESACPEEVGESLLIVLENGVSLQRTVPADFKVKIECPFRQPLWWYHNEHPMTINNTLVITALKAKHHSDNYGCKTLENEKDVATKWANVTLIGCTSIAENVKDDLVLRKWHNMDDALSKRELQLLSKEATAYSTSTIPSISTATINRTALLDENVKLKCHAGDRPLVRIVWLKHYAPLNWTEKSLFNFDHNLNVWKLPTSNSEPRLLRLGSVQPEDEGWYSCVATTANQLETVIFSNYLKILNYPVDWDNFNNRSTSEFHREDTDSFEVSVESRVGKIAKKVDDNDQDNVGVTKREDGPQFKNVKKLEDNIHKPSGSSVQLMCPATGNPTPNITWTRNNTEIERTMGRVSYKKWSIQMDDATTEDSGVYKCTICNQHGCIEHSTKVTIRDRLRSPPIISDKFPQNQTVLVNNSTYLECRVVSDLEPSIKWFKYALRRNVTIKELEQTALKTVNKVTNDHNFLLDSVVTLSPDPDRPNILNFTNITHEDEGWYTCVASNTLGHSLASAYMRVVDKLPARDHTPLRGHPVWITAVAVVVVLLFLLGTVFIIYVLRKLKHEKLLKQRIETVHQWTKKVIIYRPPTAEASINCGDLQMPVIKIEKQRTTFTTSSSSDPMQGFNEYEFPLDSNWEIPRSQLVLGSVLGEGAFGRVVMGEANDLSTSQRPTGTTTIVAVKMVKEEHTDADMTSLVHEMEVMKMIGKHINIINLLGCCSQNGPLWVIVEFAPHGNLKDFLKKNRPLSTWNGRNPEYLKKDEECVQLTEKHLISFAFQIARGMEYLASRRCIHRDLAARNVLVSNDFVMKIADFGLARDVQDTDYYRKKTNGRLPIKWMAPESLQDKFYDSQSDVWSYGVLLWEIMTYGEQPYPLIMSAEELYSYLIAGQRMEKPQHCSLNIYMLMRQCWHFDSNARPTFAEIVENLDKILQLANNMLNEEYLDLSIPILETPPSSSDDESLADTLPDKVVVEQKDLLQAFNTTRPTLTAAEIAKYQTTYAKFTNKDRSFQEPVTKRTTLA